MNFDIKNIAKLVKILTDNDLQELSLKENDKNQGITIKKNHAMSNTQTQIIPAMQVYEPATQNDLQKAESKTEDSQQKGKPILAPMVGTFYAASSPQAAPFVQVGDIISKGQVVCILEAMKLMNEIESEIEGKIIQICVKDGETVESGQVLMYIE